MTETGQQLKQHTQLSYKWYTNKKEDNITQEDVCNTQAQTQPTEKIDDKFHQISETIMVELQHSTFVSLVRIYFVWELFPFYANEASLDVLMDYKNHGIHL